MSQTDRISWKTVDFRCGRRTFLRSCALCGAGLAAGSLMPFCSAKETTIGRKLRLRVIYSLHEVIQARPDWPNVGFDFGPVMERIDRELANGCPEFAFDSMMATGPEEAEQILSREDAAQIDGYLVYQLNCWNRVVQTIAASGKPVLYADFQYGGSGGFLVYTAAFLREQAPNIGFVASSRMEDLVAAVKSFGVLSEGGSPADFAAASARVRRQATPGAGNLTCLRDDLKTLSPEDCLRRMGSSRILAVRDQNSGPADPIMGIPMEWIAFAEVNEAWESADKEQARSLADRWQGSAEAVIDVPYDTLVNSAAMYLGMRDVLERHSANAITINCLGGFYGGHIHAYPCLGFHELNNQGLVGACECDVRSTATMTAFTAMTGGRPGMISDPVIDSAKRQIIYAHCVASSKVFGPEGSANPFAIMTHSEDRQGASVRSVLPTGYMTTTLEILPDRKEILLHRAKAVGNDPDDRACRTKLCAEPVGDLEKLFTMWDRWGWHRVTFYGDLKEPAYGLADAMGWSVVEEA